MEVAALLRRLIGGHDMTPDESANLIGTIMDGALTPVQGAGLLVALAAKGERIEEVAGAARAMRERAVRVDHGLPEVVDVVGTGGDGANTINISTMAALVAASAGLPIAKHGNRAASSACGSADVLEATGLPLDLSPEQAAQMLRQAHFTFLFAPRYHPAMKNVGPIRRELGVRTVFNILGPLTNPAHANIQIVGVSRAELLPVMGDVLRALGVERGAIVHGSNGIDEVAGDVPTAVYSFGPDGTREWTIDPREFGISVPLEHIVGGSVDVCRDAFLAILGGKPSPGTEVVALNAALVLYTAGREKTLVTALEKTRNLLASGEPLRTYERAKALASNG